MSLPWLWLGCVLSGDFGLNLHESRKWEHSRSVRDLAVRDDKVRVYASSTLRGVAASNVP